MGTENQKSPLSGLSLGQAVGIGAADAGFNFLGNLAMSSIENARYRENQEQNFELAQQAQREAGTNQKIALENAGVSPAVMNGGQFQTATPNQAPLQNKGLNMSFMGAALQAQQLKMMQAQTEQQEIINNRMRDEDTAYDSGMKDQFRAIIRQLNEEGSTDAANVYQSMLDGMAQRGESFSKGSFDGWNNAIKMIGSANEQTKRTYQERFAAAVARQKLTTPNAIDAEAMLPKATYDKVLAEISKIEIDKLVGITESGKNSAQIKLIGQQVNEVIAHITQMLASAALDDSTALQRYHSDFASMIKNGDYGAAAISLTAGVVQEIIPAITTKGLSTAIKGAKEADKMANGPRYDKPQLTERHTVHYNKKGERVGSTLESRSYAFPSQSSDHE